MCSLPRLMKILAAVATSLGLGSVGCVSEATYDEALVDLHRARQVAMQREWEAAALKWQAMALAREVQLRDAQLKEGNTAQQFVSKLEELLADNASMAERLRKTEEALQQLANQAQDPTEQPATLKAQLEALRTQRLASESRVAAYRELLSV